jgi:ribosomal-protein-alanine N-acetyltransferase
MTTERLILRQPESADAEALRAYYRRNAERFALWDPVRPDDLAFHRQWIEAKGAESLRSGQAGAWLAFAKDTGQLVAVVTLDGFTAAEPRSAMLAYTVDEKYEGRGFAGEAVARIIRFAFDQLGLGELSAYYHPDNARSAKLLERAGFRIAARAPAIPGFERLMRPQVLAVLRAGGAR